jgi:PTH1 family peptidyl-tRNA hydrolase
MPSAPDPSDPWIVAGLGNPGPRYEHTPHNLGFMAVDALARRHRLAWKDERKFRTLAARAEIHGIPVWLLKPMTFMNASGEAVGPFARYYKVPPERVLAVFDEIALPMGRLRLRADGSDGGHNGMKNMIAHLGTSAFPRLRIGIAPGENRIPSLEAFVLARMHGAYAEDAAFMAEKAADFIELLLRDGLAQAMNRANAFDARKTGA